MKHFSNNAKEYLKMTEEDKKYRQGRSKYRVEQTEKFAGGCMVACIVMIGILAIVNAFIL